MSAKSPREVVGDIVQAGPQLAIGLIWDVDDDVKFQAFVSAVERQTVNGLQLIVSTTIRSLRLPKSRIEMVLQMHDSHRSVSSRLSGIMAAARRPYVVLFPGGDLRPAPFLQEIAAMQIARFSPDAIFFESPVVPIRSMAHGLVGPVECFATGLYAPVLALRREVNFAEGGNDGLKPSDIIPQVQFVDPQTLNGPDNAIAILPPSLYLALWQAVLSNDVELALCLGGLILADGKARARLSDDQAVVSQERANSHELGRRRKEYRLCLLPELDMARFQPRTAIPFRSSKGSDFRFLIDLLKLPLPNATSASDYPIAQDFNDRALVEASGLFDRTAYLAAHPDVAQSGIDPLEHYLRYGGQEGRPASHAFHSKVYLESYPDVAACGANPLVHYLRSGRQQGRSRWTFLGEVPAHEEAILRASTLFDPAYYMASNVDLDPNKVDPYWHYLYAGGIEGRAPSAKFDAKHYLTVHPELLKARINPLLHYLNLGRALGHLIRPTEPDAWDDVFHCGPRIVDRIDWDLDMKQDLCAVAWLATSPISCGSAAELLCCIPYAVQDFLTLRIVDQVHQRGVQTLLTVQHETPATYRDDTGPWSRRPDRVLKLYEVADDKGVPDLLVHLIRSRGIRTMLIAGAFDTYSLLPRLKKACPDLRVVDQLFNPVGHTRASLTFAPYIDDYLVESRMMRDFLVNRDVPANRIHVVKSGVDLARFAVQVVERRDVDELRFRCGFDPSVTMVVGYVGRMASEKDPLGFVEIARLLAALRIDVGFVIVGGGPEADIVRREAANLLPSGRIAVLGFVEDVRHAMMICDVMVVPSKVDGRPGAIMEANALGIPVIGTSVGGIPDLITDGLNGFLFHSGNYGDAARLIATLAADRGGLADLAAAARARAVDEFDQEHMFETYTRLLGSPDLTQQP